MTKQEIRSEMKLRGREFAASGKENSEVPDIWAKIESLPEFGNAGTVLLYMDIEGEVPTINFIDRWRSSKRILIPKVVGNGLRLYEYAPDKLTEGYRGIAEPSEDAVPASCSEVDLAIVPGVAFTRSGIRLGRGKGFYDRLLPQLACPKIGICFSYRILPDIPSDPWDFPLDKVISL